MQAAHSMVAAYHAREKIKQVAAKADACRTFRHARTRVVHYGHCEHSDRTGCGHLISEVYDGVVAEGTLTSAGCNLLNPRLLDQSWASR